MYFVFVCLVFNWNSVILFVFLFLLVKDDNLGCFFKEKNCGFLFLVSKDGIMNFIEEDDIRYILYLLLLIWFKINYI